MTAVNRAHLAILVSSLTLWACNVNLDVDGRLYGCSTDADCGAGFICEAGVCQPTNMVAGDTSSSGADTSSGGMDTSSGGTDTSSGGTDTSSGGADSSSSGMDTGGGQDMDVMSVEGMCTSTPDSSILASTVTLTMNGNSEFVSGYQAAIMATALCLSNAPSGADAAYLISCASGEPFDVNLSEGCLDCFADVMLCGLEHCEEPCFLTPGNEGNDLACVQCIEGENPAMVDCINLFNTCRGNDVFCLEGENVCGLACTDPNESDGHCGGCFRPCDLGQECVAGSCGDPGCAQVTQSGDFYGCIYSLEGLIASESSLRLECWPANNQFDTFCANGESCAGGGVGSGCQADLDFGLTNLSALDQNAGITTFDASFDVVFGVPFTLKAVDGSVCGYTILNLATPYSVTLFYQQTALDDPPRSELSCTPPSFYPPLTENNAEVISDSANSTSCPRIEDATFTAQVRDDFLGRVLQWNIDNICNTTRSCVPCGQGCPLSTDLVCPTR